MNIILTYSEVSNRCNNWNALCGEIGLNSWYMNEGLVDGDDELKIDCEIAKRYGLIKTNNN